MFEMVYFSGSVIFLAATWCYVRIRSGGHGGPPT
jgi:hypothetical protein